MPLLAKKVDFSRPKTMATKISHKVWEYPTHPPYLGNISKKYQFFLVLPLPKNATLTHIRLAMNLDR